MSSYTPAPRLFLVSNRLPVSIKRIEPGKFEFAQGSGGLVTGLSGLSETTEFRWYGWPGLEIAEVEVRSLSDQLASGHNAVPVLLEDGLADKYYNGFSSKNPLSLIIHGLNYPTKILFFGHFSTINQERSHSANRLGRPTR